MQPDQYEKPHSPYRGAAWLNGSVWASMGGCLLLALAQHGYDWLLPLICILLLAGLGAFANLLLALWQVIRGRGQQAWLYFGGFVLLAMFSAGYFIYGIKHFPGKIGG